VLSDYAKTEGAAARDKVQASGEDALARGQQYADAARTKASDGAAQALEQVRRQPAAAVGIAVGVGFLVGLVAGRR